MTKLIQVFEHQTLKVDRDSNFTPSLLQALQRHYGEKGKPYYSLMHNGVRFNQFVGVIQVANVTIEVLPKVDRTDKNSNKVDWQKRLIDILLTVSSIDANITGVANLKLKANSVLEAYFSLFINEVEFLFHKGLIKQYHKQQANLTTLKGRLNFSQHICHNIVHKERFFVEHTIYDQQNIYNQILYKTIKLISQLNTNHQLALRINLLLLNFPEMADIYVDNTTFERIVFNRKNQHYQSALFIAKLLLLNYHPDLTQGRPAVLSLMFDMNRLWEKFVLASLHRYNQPHINIQAQNKKDFWDSNNNYKTTMKADIIIHNKINNRCFVLDTKWKCPDYQKPSIDDLRQLYTYHHYYKAHKVALVYPSHEAIKEVYGQYVESDKSCSLLFLHSPENYQGITQWQKDISQTIFTWCDIL